MSWLLAIAGILLVMLLGFLLWEIATARKPDFWESLAYAFPVGSGVTVIVMLLLAHFGQPLSRNRIMGSILFLIAAAILVLRGLRRPLSSATYHGKGNHAKGKGILWWCLLGVLAFQIVLVALPIIQERALGDWDAWAIWGLKAKAFYVDKGVSGYLGNAQAYAFSWPSRPCLSSLVEAFVYSSMGGVHESAARGVHVFWFVSLLWIFYIATRRVMSRTSALFWTLVLSAIPNLAFQSNLGLSNMVLGSYLFAAIAALDRWRRHRDIRVLAAAAVLLGIAALCRDEGVPLAIILTAAVVLTAESLRRSGLRTIALQTTVLVLGTIVIKSIWTLIVQRYSLANLMDEWLSFRIFGRAAAHFHDLPSVLRMALQELAIPEFQSRSLHFEKIIGVALFWPAFALAALRLFLGKSSNRLALACTLAAFTGMAMYTAGYWLFPYQNLADLRDNWLFVMDRQMLCLVPLAAYVIAWSVSGNPSDQASSELEQPQ